MRSRPPPCTRRRGASSFGERRWARRGMWSAIESTIAAPHPRARRLARWRVGRRVLCRRGQPCCAIHLRRGASGGRAPDVRIFCAAVQQGGGTSSARHAHNCSPPREAASRRCRSQHAMEIVCRVCRSARPAADAADGSGQPSGRRSALGVAEVASRIVGPPRAFFIHGVRRADDLSRAYAAVRCGSRIRQLARTVKMLTSQQTHSSGFSLN